jgi:hypothetical protein
LAKTALNPSVINDYLDMEQRWLALARSYEFAERLSTFVDPHSAVTRRTTKKRPAL